MRIDEKSVDLIEDVTATLTSPTEGSQKLANAAAGTAAAQNKLDKAERFLARERGFHTLGAQSDVSTAERELADAEVELERLLEESRHLRWARTEDAHRPSNGAER